MQNENQKHIELFVVCANTVQSGGDGEREQTRHGFAWLGSARLWRTYHLR